MAVRTGHRGLGAPPTTPTPAIAARDGWPALRVSGCCMAGCIFLLPRCCSWRTGDRATPAHFTGCVFVPGADARLCTHNAAKVSRTTTVSVERAVPPPCETHVRRGAAARIESMAPRASSREERSINNACRRVISKGHSSATLPPWRSAALNACHRIPAWHQHAHCPLCHKKMRAEGEDNHRGALQPDEAHETRQRPGPTRSEIIYDNGEHPHLRAERWLMLPGHTVIACVASLTPRRRTASP